MLWLDLYPNLLATTNMKIKVLLLFIALFFFNSTIFANCPDLVPDIYFCSFQSGDHEAFRALGMQKQGYIPLVDKGVSKLLFSHASKSIATRQYDLSTGKLITPIEDTVANLSCDADYLTETLYSNKDGLRKIRLRKLGIDKYEALYSKLETGEDATSTEVRMSCRLDSSESWRSSLLDHKEKDKIRKKIEPVLNKLYATASRNIKVINLSIVRVEQEANNYKVYIHYQIKSDKGQKAEQYRIVHVRKDKNGYTPLTSINPLTALVNDDIARQYGNLNKACDTLAEHPLDPNKKRQGVAWEDLDPTAYKICLNAVVASKGNVKSKTRYQLLRVQDRIRDGFSDYKEYQKDYILPELKNLGDDYPMAYFSAAMEAGVSGDYNEKYRLLKQAKQIPASFTYRAFMYVDGEYNDTNSTQEKYEKIHNLYITGAQLGDLTAKERLAEEKLYGYYNQEKDVDKALDMLKDLAKQGNEEAMEELAKYEDKYLGRYLAFKYLKPLAIRGNINAIHDLISIVLTKNHFALSDQSPSKSDIKRNYQTLAFINSIYQIGINQSDDKSRIALAGLPLLYPQYYDRDKVGSYSLHLLEGVFDKNYYAARDWVKVNFLMTKTKSYNPQQAKKLLRKLANKINRMEKTEFKNLVKFTHAELVKTDNFFSEMTKREWQQLRDKLKKEIKKSIQSIE